MDMKLTITLLADSMCYLWYYKHRYLLLHEIYTSYGKRTWLRVTVSLTTMR